MNDITIIMLTLNKVPKAWAAYHKKVLLEASKGCPIITLSKEPMDYGFNIIQTEKPSLSNIYWQMLKGAGFAKTEYIGFAEDDTLYPPDHFTFRPHKCFGYNLNRWAMLTWGDPYFFYKEKYCNGGLISPTKLFVEYMSARFKNYRELPYKLCNEPGGIADIHMGRRRSKTVRFETKAPFVTVIHRNSIDRFSQQKKKRPTNIWTYELPHWGEAKELRRLFV